MPDEPLIGGGLGNGGGAPPVKDVTTATFHGRGHRRLARRSRSSSISGRRGAAPASSWGRSSKRRCARPRRGALVKINIDENPEIAQQLRIQSIPAVYAFKDGRPVDGFVGAVPESQIKQFVQRLGGGRRGPSPVEEALAMAKEALQTGDHDSAGGIFSPGAAARAGQHRRARRPGARADRARASSRQARELLDARAEGAARPCRDRRGARGARARRAGAEGDGRGRPVSAPGSPPTRTTTRRARPRHGAVRRRRARGGDRRAADALSQARPRLERGGGAQAARQVLRGHGRRPTR